MTIQSSLLGCLFIFAVFCSFIEKFLAILLLSRNVLMILTFRSRIKILSTVLLFALMFPFFHSERYFINIILLYLSQLNISHPQDSGS